MIISRKCLEIIEFMEEFAPVQLAEPWDNVGLIIGSQDMNIDRVMVCLDVTSRVIEDAIDKKINLIISHHPFIFNGLKSINISNPQGRAISDIIKNEISVYSAHTNYDAAAGGINHQLAELLELKDVRPLICTSLEDYLNSKECGLGRIGLLNNPIKIKDLISTIKDKLNINNVRVIGWVDKDINKVAVFCGSYDSSILSIVMKKADILITGDIKYHSAVEIEENMFCAIDAGHFNTEKIMVYNTAKLLAKNFPDIEVISNNLERDPFKYY